MKLLNVTLTVCEACVDGKGECCNVPGCIFCRQRPPEFGLDKQQMTINEDETSVTISMKEYHELVESDARLTRLMECGVDNWEGYGDAFACDDQ